MLHLCTRHPDKKGLQFLLKQFNIGGNANASNVGGDEEGEGNEIDVQDRNKRTPLHWAASQVCTVHSSGHFVRLFSLKSKFLLKFVSLSGCTPTVIMDTSAYGTALKYSNMTHSVNKTGILT